MQLINRTKNKIVSEHAIFLKTEKERIKGLIGEKNPKTVILETKFGIHTFFLRFPIDVVILDSHRKVMQLKESLKPNRLFFWNPVYSTVIELPEMTIKKSQTDIGDMLQYEA